LELTKLVRLLRRAVSELEQKRAAAARDRAVEGWDPPAEKASPTTPASKRTAPSRNVMSPTFTEVWALPGLRG